MADKYGDHHRMFLQGFMTRFACYAQEVKALYKHCLEANDFACGEVNNKELCSFVTEINKKIKPLQMEIRQGVSEEDGRSFYALINTADSNITRLSADYNVNELEYFKKIIEGVMHSEKGCISCVQCLNLTADLQKRMDKFSAEHLLKRFTENKWLIQYDGEVSLHGRTILELTPYLEQYYMAKKCGLCQKFAIKVTSCESCGSFFHRHCIAKLSKNHSRIKCPSCNLDFSHTEINGVSHGRKRK